MSLDAKSLGELAEIERTGGLSPARVLRHARSPTSALHTQFEWDDAAAGRAHRLLQAERLIIRARVRIVPQPPPRPIRVRPLASPPAPRAPRTTPAPSVPLPSVHMSPKLASMPAQPLAAVPTSRAVAALSELDAWILKHRALPELAGLIALIHRSKADACLRQAVDFAQNLEETGLDRRSAVERAATQFEQPQHKVIELLRNGYKIPRTVRAV